MRKSKYQRVQIFRWRTYETKTSTVKWHDEMESRRTSALGEKGRKVKLKRRVKTIRESWE